MTGFTADKPRTIYETFVKPLADRFTALVLVLILIPVIVSVALVLALSNRGRVWFVQERPGYRERPFRVIKFRTMRDTYDAMGNPLPDEMRLHRVGKMIRSASLDELPQLFNVLTGDMSIVGPRPLLMEYLPLYSEAQRKRHGVKPGITGWAQVNGRNAISWPEKFAFDTWYVEHVSFVLDVKILFLTLAKVIRSEGITSATSVSMEKFCGNE
jgi:undecaprenyl phosphate N,N'-diacetylbacillosamine 1-phosphate transferase